MHVTAMGSAEVGQQPVQRRRVAQLEDLEFGHHPDVLGPGVEVTDERPRVREHLVTEIDGATGERAGIRRGVEHGQPVVEIVGDRTASGQLNDQVSALPQCPDRVLEPGQVQRRAGMVIPDVHVDHRGPGRPAFFRRVEEFAEGDGQRGGRGLVRLGTGRRDRDERPGLGRGGGQGLCRAARSHEGKDARSGRLSSSGPAPAQRAGSAQRAAATGQGTPSALAPA